MVDVPGIFVAGYTQFLSRILWSSLNPAIRECPKNRSLKCNMGIVLPDHNHEKAGIFRDLQSDIPPNPLKQTTVCGVITRPGLQNSVHSFESSRPLHRLFPGEE